VNARRRRRYIAQSDQGPVVVRADSKSAGVIAPGGNAPTPSPVCGFFNGFIWGAAVAIDDSPRMFGGIDCSDGKDCPHENAHGKPPLGQQHLIDDAPS
jgi:hypothetical protein